ncbi:adenosine monophosphate-protein transferase [Vineibacter terrae]|uniref:protein adenylyltransferase n=1 Tax=Vineibacter terrae TaxID=2586908 RepID=A0A5C8PWC0_9HYPH|nr:Fic family protein [Vineibacter terrae]TXL82404.1 adenosine monophosphate-protein transferase [Vineibacter terrae]
MAGSPHNQLEYEASDDPYCYPGTTVLKNVPDIRDAAALEQFEIALTTQRGREPFPSGRLSATHYKAIHRHLFQDVYPWAGRFRTVRIHKGSSTFCYPENIDGEMRTLFAWLRKQRLLQDLTSVEFATAGAHFLAELNAIHPFREGNGRTQLSFLALLATKAGHPLRLRRLDPATFMAAVIESFRASEAALAAVVLDLIGLEN